MRIESLWLSSEQKLKAYLNSQLKDKSQVDDLLQTVFIKMRNKLHTLSDHDKLEQWLIQITRNTLMDFYRKEQKLNKLKTHSPEVEIRPQEENHKTELLANFIPEAIKLLPEKYREAIYLTEIKGLSQKELAEHLNISYSGAKSRVQRGREKLKEIILACCDVAADKYGNIIDFQPRAKTCSEC